MKYLAFILVVMVAFSCNTRSDLSTIENETIVKTSFKQTMADRRTDYYIVRKKDGTIDTEQTTVKCVAPPQNCLPTVVVTADNIAYYDEFTDSIQNNNHWDYFTSGNYIDLLDTLNTAIYNDIISASNHFISVEVIDGYPFYTLVDTSITISNFAANDIILAIPVEE
jgi:hypothetical protein